MIRTGKMISVANTLLGPLLVDINSGLPHCDRRSGGYLCVFSKDAKVDDPPLALFTLGLTETKKAGERFELCQEKARRLISNPRHLSSWQSRDPEEGRKGGAIRANDYIFSFDGLTEEGDEALVLAIANALKLMSGDDMNEIARISSNSLILNQKPERILRQQKVEV
jgi:hypothetical protein